MDEIKVPLVINKLQTKEIYNSLASQGRIALNELYLVDGDNDVFISAVTYNTTDKKLTYSDTVGDTRDIVTLGVLKNDMGFHSVASSGNYNELSNQPKINGVTLSGNKSFSDLGVSYDDLTDLPNIPNVTSNYSSTDTDNALNGVAVNSALANYVPNTISVTGYGALGGGGTLTENRRITHKSAPTGLDTAPIKIGVDSYGHVQAGPEITANDIGAIPTNFNVILTAQDVDAQQYGTIVINATQSETLTFNTEPKLGCRTYVYYANTSESAITLTIPKSSFACDYLFINGTLTSSSSAFSVPSWHSITITITRVSFSASGAQETAVFVDVRNQ